MTTNDEWDKIERHYGQRQRRHCAVCGREGHNRRTCPGPNAPNRDRPDAGLLNKFKGK